MSWRGLRCLHVSELWIRKVRRRGFSSRLRERSARGIGGRTRKPQDEGTPAPRGSLLRLTAIAAAAAVLTACGQPTVGKPNAAGTAGSAPQMRSANVADDAAGSDGAVGSAGTDAAASKKQPVELQVFIAASLSPAMLEISQRYIESHPDVKITFNADSSGKLQTQIEEGYDCDLFFSAGQKQMDALEQEGLLEDGTRVNVLRNHLVVIARADSGTKVRGLRTLSKAGSIAMADGSVPAGRYTRAALQNLGILESGRDAGSFTTREVSEALGGITISEQSNVSKVLIVVLEGSCETGTTYLTDTHGYEDELQILEQVPDSLTGDIVYPAALVSDSADSAQAKQFAAKDFLQYLCSDEAGDVFTEYGFDMDNHSGT